MKINKIARQLQERLRQRPTVAAPSAAADTFGDNAGAAAVGAGLAVTVVLINQTSRPLADGANIFTSPRRTGLSFITGIHGNLAE